MKNPMVVIVVLFLLFNVYFVIGVIVVALVSELPGGRPTDSRLTQILVMAWPAVVVLWVSLVLWARLGRFHSRRE